MNSATAERQICFLRLDQVRSRTGLSRSTIYAYVHEGRFPAPVNISTRCVGWIETEIDDWIVARVASRGVI
jgi:prophage regulatory protein